MAIEPSDSWLYTDFTSEKLDPRLRWLNPPTRWDLDSEKAVLRIETDADTDFWQRTHYGFRADTGHFLFAETELDFVLGTRVQFTPCNQYDQAGLMIRASADCWLKTSIEYELDEPAQLGAVVTNHGYSDWSKQDADAATRQCWFEIERRASDFIVRASLDGTNWRELRVAHLHLPQDDPRVACGLYACSPKGAGYIADFDYLRIVTL